jgi:hypothetical protein
LETRTSKETTVTVSHRSMGMALVVCLALLQTDAALAQMCPGGALTKQRVREMMGSMDAAARSGDMIAFGAMYSKGAQLVIKDMSGYAPRAGGFTVEGIANLEQARARAAGSSPAPADKLEIDIGESACTATVVRKFSQSSWIGGGDPESTTSGRIVYTFSAESGRLFITGQEAMIESRSPGP